MNECKIMFFVYLYIHCIFVYSLYIYTKKTRKSVISRPALDKMLKDIRQPQ